MAMDLRIRRVAEAGLDPSTIIRSYFIKNCNRQLGYDPTTQDANSWLNSLSTTITPEAQDTGMFGGGIGPWLRDAFPRNRRL